MEVLKKSIYILIGAWFLVRGAISFFGIPVLYYLGMGQELFAGISIYKVPANLVGGLAGMYGGYLAIKNHRKALIFLGLDVAIYLVSATFEIILENGFFWFWHINPVFFRSAGTQIALFIVLYFVLGKANKSLNTDTSDAGAG